MAATARYLTAIYNVTAGISTAYTAPSGTAVTVLKMIFTTHELSGTAGGVWSAQIKIGPTAAMIPSLPLTAISARQGLEYEAPTTLPSAHGAVVISASTSHVFSFYLNGLEH